METDRSDWLVPKEESSLSLQKSSSVMAASAEATFRISSSISSSICDEIVGKCCLTSAETFDY